MVQPIDYSFIATAGGQLGGAIAKIPEQQRAEEEYKAKKTILDKQLAQIDVTEQTANDVYYQNIQAAADEWDNTFGDGKGVIMARKVYPLTLVESYKDPKASIQAQLDADEKWKKFLDQKKIELMRSSPKTVSEDMYSQAQKLGVTEAPEFKQDFQRQQNIEAGMMYAPGQTQGQYSSSVSVAGIDPSVGAAKEIKSGLMSDNQIAIDSRQRDIADQRARLREVHDKMVETRLRAGNADKNILRLLDSQIRAVQAQIKASENRSEIALGLKTGKDWEGKAVYSTGPEWKAEFEDAESTYTSAQKLLDYIDQLNKSVNPIPATPTAGEAPRPRRSLDSFSK